MLFDQHSWPKVPEAKIRGSPEGVSVGYTSLEASDFGLLQPVVPGPGFGLLLAHTAVQAQQAAKSEQELLFRSGAVRAASGEHMAAFTSAGTDAVEEQT
jgi:hypothetical protein